MYSKIIKLIPFVIVMVALTSCKSDDPEPGFVPGNVIVGFQKEVTLRQAIDFANNYSDGIGTLSGFFYYSNLPADSLDFIKNFITAEGIEYTSVQISATTIRIVIIKNYLNYDDKSTIDNWLAMTENPILQFEDVQANKNMLLFISPGTEKQWIKTHISDPYVRYAELNYYFP